MVLRSAHVLLGEPRPQWRGRGRQGISMEIACDRAVVWDRTACEAAGSIIDRRYPEQRIGRPAKQLSPGRLEP